MNKKKPNAFIKVFSVFFLLVSIYLSNAKLDSTNGDALTFRYVSCSILHEFDFDLDEYYQRLVRLYPWICYPGPAGESIPYYLIKVNGHYLPTDGVGPAILSLPLLFIPITVFGLSADSWAVVFLSKLTASALIALSAVFIFLAVKLLSGEKKAWIVAFVYALCSGMWSITSQALYQQTGSEFFLALSVYFLVRGIKEERFVPLSGFSLACAVLMRPTNIMLMLLLSAYVLQRHRAKFLRFLFFAAPVILFIAGYNYYNHGSPFLFSLMVYNPQGAFYKTGSYDTWSTPLSTGLLGLLVSPSRGLFIYSPVFIFSFFGMILVWVKKKHTIFKYFAAACIILTVIHSKWYDWWGGWTFGCRMLNDAVPFLSLLLLPFMSYLGKNKMFAWLFVSAAAFSFAVQIIGAFLYNNAWNSHPDIDLHQQRLWSWRNSQLVYYLHELCPGRR